MSAGLENVRQAILLGNAPAFESVLQYVQNTLAAFQQTVNIQALTSKIPAISQVTGNLITLYPDGLFYSGASPTPGPAPSPTVDSVSLYGLFPVGTAPTGWLKANGALVSRTTYAALFARIGIQFGIGDGLTTFKLPDWRGAFARALDDGRGIDTGRVINSEQASQNLAHTHNTVSNSVVQGATTLASGPDFGITVGPTVTVSSGGAEVRVFNVALMACIRIY